MPNQTGTSLAPQATPRDAAGACAPYLSVAAPVYNEAANIEPVVREWQQCLARLGVTAEIVLYNDGSTDGTGAILDRLRGELPALRVVGDSRNHGYGHAMSQAVANCRGEYVAMLDSDGQFDLNDLAALLEAVRAEGCAAVTGYRVKKRDTWLRVVADRGLRVVVRLLFRTRLRDPNCPLKLVRRDLLQRLRLEATGYPFPTELCVKAEALGIRWAERPVRHLYRAGGTSKLKLFSTAWRAFRFFWYLRRRLRLYRAGLLREP